MATLVSSYPPLRAGQRPAARNPAQRAERTQDLRFGALLASALTLFAVAVHGYHPYAEDGGLYLAGVKRLLDPSLYPQVAEFVQAPTRFSAFAPLVAGLVRLLRLPLPYSLPLPYALLALHLAGTWLTLFAAWLLAARCFAPRSGRAGAVVLLACWLDLPVAGTALLLMDPYLTARSLSTPCMLLALVGALDATAGNPARRRTGLALWGGAIALASAVHPLMAAYALGCSLLLASLRSQRKALRLWGTSALCATALAAAAIAQGFAPPESLDYVRIAMTRTYWFPAAWRWYELAGLWAPLGILGLLAWRWQSEAGRVLARMAFLAGGCATVVAVLFAREQEASHLVAALQPLRVFQVVYVAMIVGLGGLLGERLLGQKPWRWAAALVLLGAPMLLASRETYPHSSHLEMPWSAPANSWERAFVWIRRNTPKDALFALDADYVGMTGEDAQGFRAIAERSALPDYSKDGGEASIAPRLTAAWVAGQAAQQGLSSASDAQRITRLKPLGVSWVVLSGAATTTLTCPFHDAAVKVCRLP